MQDKTKAQRSTSKAGLDWLKFLKILYIEIHLLNVILVFSLCVFIRGGSDLLEAIARHQLLAVNCKSTEGRTR